MTEAERAAQKGLEVLLEKRRQLAESGAQPAGWKAAFGSAEAKRRLGLAHLLVGFLTDHSVVPSGSTVCVAGWRRPVAEPEVVVRLRADLAAGTPPEAVAAAVEAVGPAIELADVDRNPEEDLEGLVAGNIFHRYAVVGPLQRVSFPGALVGSRGRVFQNGTELATVHDLESMPGRVVDVLGEMAGVLAGFGERLRAGELVICGSVIPPLFLDAAEQHLAFELVGVGRVAVNLTGKQR